MRRPAEAEIDSGGAQRVPRRRVRTFPSRRALELYVEATPKSSFEAAIAKMIIEIPAHGEARRIRSKRV